MLGFCGFRGRGVKETGDEEKSALVGDGLGVVSDTEVVGSVVNVNLTSLGTDKDEISREDRVNTAVWGVDEDKSVADGEEEILGEGLDDVVTPVDCCRGVADGDRVARWVVSVVVRVDDNWSVFGGDRKYTEESLVDVVKARVADESWGAEDVFPVTIVNDAEEEEVITWLSTKKQTNIEF